RGDVVPTAGGMLGQLFGSEPTAKGPKDDGRKAYPLPPPDPASVNWSGVPYHAPKTGTLASSAGEDQPIRDVSPSSTRSPAATARSSTAAARPTTQPALSSATPQPPRASEPTAGVASARVAAV